MDRLTKLVHFIPIKMSFNGENLTSIYVSEIVHLHGVPISIILDWGSVFISSFWRAF